LSSCAFTGSSYGSDGEQALHAATASSEDAPMHYVIINWVHPDDAAAWMAMSADEQAADVERHRTWFRKYSEKVVGGEELDFPPKVKTIRPGRQGDGVIVTDGPHVETKEMLGGFVIIEAADMEEAVAIASEWPSLSSQPNATVQVHPAFQR
jgi:hypothetical protein